MSCAIKTTYLNWLIGTSIGLALIYRNCGPDRIIGGFLLIASLIFLFEYGLVNTGDPDSMTMGILILLGLSLIVFGLLQQFTLHPENESMKMIQLLYLVIASIAGIYIFIQSFSNIPSMSDERWYTWGDWSTILVFIIIFIIGAFLIGYLTGEYLFPILSLLLIFVPFFQAKGYYLIITLLLITSLWWLIPYYTKNTFHKK